MPQRVHRQAFVLDWRKTEKKQQSGIRSLICLVKSTCESFFVTCKAFLIVTILSSGVLSLPNMVSAATTLEAKTSGATIRLEAGESKKIFVSFTNVGTKTWTAGLNGTAVYLYGNSSIFGHPSWLKDDVPALIDQASVGPGKVATASFWIKAPSKAGKYRERFLLSAGKNVWVKGSVTQIDFIVENTSQTTTTNDKNVGTSVSIPAAPPVTFSSDWKADLVDKGGIEWQTEPGGHVMVTLSFKNTGIKTWKRDGTSYVSLYTGTDNRKSPFKDFSWKTEVQAARLKEMTVTPGQIGHFVLELRAPETPGSYTETFQLASEDTAWMGGNSSVSLPFLVSTPNQYVATKDAGSGLAIQGTPTSGQYRTLLMLRSTQALQLMGNGRQQLTFGFKNTGLSTWNTLSLKFQEVTPTLSGKLSAVRDESWVNSVEPVRGQQVTAPGQIGFVQFKIKAPTLKGKYTASFRLYADEQPIEDGLIDIPITVTADGAIEPEVSSNAQNSVPGSVNSTVQQGSGPSSPSVPVVPLGGDTSRLPNEPIIRVGLFRTTDDQMQVRGVKTGFSLQQDGTIVCRFSQGELVTVKYDRVHMVYTANGPRCTTQSSKYYVTVVDDGISPLELADFSRPVSWLPGANDNTFRSKLELRYTPATDGVWIINELLVESYIKGLAETSDVSPIEFQKALLTAARTYAMYHVQRGTKHADEFYTVDAKYDQVYRGYGAEARSPKIVAGVDATRGQIVTYQEKLAITPYFSRSDGRTRSWSEVWGGSYAWLMTVPVPQDNGKTLWGHGVGMSASGALGMANEGRNYQEILKHFYTGIDLRQIYK
ncbi:hypothetical protein IT408_03535 [Candidatus Uhrbacteria bacterium]|nr:hypothetical protein [Candidatus Uhrbacteria bacterium]